MGIKRIQMDISDEGLKELLKLKDELYSTTMAETIRSSLRIAKKIQAEKKAGNKIVVIEPNNKQRELEFV
jgi:hypothetical protein